MRLLITLGAMIAGLTTAAGARAAPSVEVRGAAARLVVIPEGRSDIAVSAASVNRRLPLRVRRLGERLLIQGNVGGQIHGCRNLQGARSVAIWSRGAVPYEQLPVLIVHTPLAVRLSISDAVYGEVQPSRSVDFTNKGCGDWSIGDVQGRLRLNQAGSGAARAGVAGSADLSVAGAGGISTGLVRGPLRAVSSGSGDIAVASVQGPVDARVAGPGNIDIAAGAATTMSADIAGSGAVTLHGTAGALTASIAGKGDVSVTKVLGRVTKQVFGTGAVRIGR